MGQLNNCFAYQKDCLKSKFKWFILNICNFKLFYITNINHKNLVSSKILLNIFVTKLFSPFISTSHSLLNLSLSNMSKNILLAFYEKPAHILKFLLKFMQNKQNTKNQNSFLCETGFQNVICANMLIFFSKISTAHLLTQNVFYASFSLSCQFFFHSIKPITWSYVQSINIYSNRLID